MAVLELRLLGPVEARVDGRPVPLGTRKQRLVLAILALEANRQVPMERLVDLVWPDGPPRTATHAVRVCVSGLRAALAAAGAGAGAGVDIVTRGTGYLLAAGPSTVDAHRFRSLLAEARGASGEAERVALLDRALALWTGQALAGAALPSTAQRLCAGLEEARVAAMEDRLDALLRLGRHRELVDELADLVSGHPLRERLAGQQMLALYRSGRAGDALAAYRRLRADLAEQLGLDPDAALQRLEVAILRDEDPRPAPPPAVGPAEPAVAVAAAVAVPAQLPPAVAGFAGRSAELAALDALTAPAAVAVIEGTAGVGKTKSGFGHTSCVVFGLAVMPRLRSHLAPLPKASCCGLGSAVAWCVGGSCGIIRLPVEQRWFRRGGVGAHAVRAPGTCRAEVASVCRIC